MNLFNNIILPKEKSIKQNLFNEKNLFNARVETKNKFINNNFKPTLKIKKNVYENREALISHVKYILIDNGLIKQAIEFIDLAYKTENLKSLLHEYINLFVDGKKI